jgi:ABC-type Fe3+-hydroxamate transport system substrate-binding protein
VERAGGRNTFGDIAAPSAPVSIEAVAERDPRFVLRVTSMPASSFSVRPEWASIGALAHQRIVTLSGSEFMRPTPRAPEAIVALRGALSSR